ncbi:MAG: hypothetical protein ACJAVY_002299 [Marinoscillum sp.]|jgi:hypothetical protein
MRRHLLIILLLSVNYIQAQESSLKVLYEESIAAYEAKDYKSFLGYSIRLNDIRPNHPTLSYNLAAALALNNKEDDAIAALKHHLGMNASKAYMKDDDFISLRESESYIQIEAYVDSLNTRIERSKLSLTLPQKEDHFESITHDPADNSFYLGSVNTRSVLKFQRGVLVKYLSGRVDLFAVMGLDIDKKRNVLWICSASLPQMNDYSDSLANLSSVFAIDLYTGNVLKTFMVKNATLGDIISDTKGNAIASDSHRNKLYNFSLAGYQVLMELPKEIINLQGLALNKKSLYIADYLTGLYEINLDDQSLNKLDNNGLYSDKGIDGLLFYKDGLIAFQNGTTPKRVFSLGLDKSIVTQVKTIDQSLAYEGESTQGVIVKNELVFIASSAWNAYPKGPYDPEQAEDLAIRKLELINFLIK